MEDSKILVLHLKVEIESTGSGYKEESSNMRKRFSSLKKWNRIYPSIKHYFTKCTNRDWTSPNRFRNETGVHGCLDFFQFLKFCDPDTANVQGPSPIEKTRYGTLAILV